MRHVNDFAFDLRYALRALREKPRFAVSATTILTPDRGAARCGVRGEAVGEGAKAVDTLQRML